MKLFFILLLSIPLINTDLQIGFYNSLCPQAESIVLSVIKKHFAGDHSITATFLHMHFHDCFVRGCDASILIDSKKKKKKSEKAAGPNLTVRGFNIINEAKTSLEDSCPSTVSCADIIALATRDTVALAGGLNYSVPTGRRDGLILNEADVNLPGPSLSNNQAFQFFAAKGLTLDDMVVLLGGHTVGVAHCGFSRDRLDNFQGSGVPESTMDPSLKAQLVKTCGSRPKKINNDPTTFLDQHTSFLVDNEYYKQILGNKGVMQIDQELALDSSSSGIVAALAFDGNGFLQKFADALVKLGRIEVLDCVAGEIRNNCRTFNAPSLKSSRKQLG